MVIVLVGVSGSGKSTVGKRLARKLHFDFYEGDDYHTESSKEKMRAGIALDDTDRQPWLTAIRQLIAAILSQDGNGVVAYSGLKQSHRDGIEQPGVQLVYLKGDSQLIRGRLERRKGHFFDPELLASQFAILEEPRDALVVDIAKPPEAIVGEIVRCLGLEERRE